MKTLDIQAKEWFDKKNGNSYFAAVITLDYGTDKEKTFILPFQYGYGNQYEHEAKAVLTEHNQVSCGYGQSLSRYCQENNIEFNSSIQRDCKQRELKQLVG